MKPHGKNPAVFEYTAGQETAHAIVHGIGAGLGVAALALMVVRASFAEAGVAWKVVSASLFGATIILLYLASTLYHALWTERAKKLFEIFDHQAIYLLIAGSYTPFTLVTLRGWVGWAVFGVIWGLAILGIVFKAFTAGRFRLASTLLYIGMGWIVLVTLRPLIVNLSRGGLWWLGVGGLLYTAGTVFYLWRRLSFSHAVWHAFVLAGTVCHFFCVFFHVIK
jgi:hemolysin III